MAEGSTPGAAIRHPITLVALGVWVLNDHLLKGLAPAGLTGKLSDVACLVVVPLIPVAALELWRARNGRGWHAPRGLLLLAVTGTGLVMATINTLDGAAWAYRHGLAAMQWPFRQVGALLLHGTLAGWRPVHLTMDPSDLWTLPALIVPLWVASRGQARATE